MVLPSPLCARNNWLRELESGNLFGYKSTCSSYYLAWPPFIARRHRHSLPCDP